MRNKIAGFYLCLSLSVVPSVSVESVMESNDVLMTCFCAVSLSGMMQSSMPLAATQACSLRTQHCRFSRTCYGCLPTFCDTRESKVPAILQDWQKQSFVVDCGKASVVAIFLAPWPCEEVRVVKRVHTLSGGVHRLATALKVVEEVQEEVQEVKDE